MGKSSGEGTINVGFEKELENKIQSKKNEALTSKETENESQEVTRQSWDSPLEFLLSCVALSVGLGNIWRFPFVAYENGGGAFLIPYIIVLLFIGKPFYYMEMIMGQFASYGSVKVWAMVPAFKGVGYGQALATWSVVCYYVSLMALTLFYIFSSFSKILPWVYCPENITNCVDKSTNFSLVEGNTTISSSEMYFVNEVIKKHPSGLDDGIFAPEWRLSLCLLVSWVAIFFTLVKGVKSSGKSAYFTALFPYVVLFILLGRGVTLPGAVKGIMYFITPQWEKLLEPTVWYAAVSQSFFSLAVGFGSIIMFSSYSSFDHNIYRDATIISITDTLTSMLAGFTIFAILGHSAELMGIDDIDQVIKGGGTTLAFVSYPDVLARFDLVPQLFAVIFFLMLFTLGLGSASGLTGACITIICDAFPHLKRSQVVLGTCVTGYLLGLFFVTPQGSYLVDLVDYYGGSFIIYILAWLEVVAVQWVYGYANFVRDIEFMLGRRTGVYWKFCWVYFMPSILLVIFVYKLIVQEPLTSGSYVFGPVANYLGIAFTVSAVGLVPLCFVHTFYKNTKKCTNISEAFMRCFRPSEKWCPKDPAIRKRYLEYLESDSNINLTAIKNGVIH